MIFLAIFSGVVLTLLIALCVLIAVRFSEAFKDALSLTQATHTRSMETLEGVLDRFMAVDFSEYKLRQMEIVADHGYQEMPDRQEEVEEATQVLRPWGETEYERAQRENEEKILSEDFQEELDDVANR